MKEPCCVVSVLHNLGNERSDRVRSRTVAAGVGGRSERTGIVRCRRDTLVTPASSLGTTGVRLYWVRDFW